ncbi:MAG TPA: polysaccharide biosynthesis C-terminal domain-containing protein [Granulicella sp.]|nr:polysaccharide biosynthesis C-terminal domain-containing protein [Granulicella sp.]
MPEVTGHALAAPLPSQDSGPPPTSATTPTATVTTAKFARNSAANVLRLGLTSLVAILLPAYLTHHLPVATYGAWVLILQLGAYVSYLDFGVQTAVAKYIAEYEAKGDYDGCSRCASVGLAIMLAAAALGVVLTLLLAWRAPHLFRAMPPNLLADARISILFVGVSLSITLAASVFSAVFLGLQRYQVPMVSGVATRLLYAAVICVAVALHSSLATMGAAVAAANVAGALLQVVLWKRLAAHVKVTLQAIDRTMLRQMLAYCAVLTIWSVCMLFITGIDITLVGHYAFNQVAFYSIASSPTNLILLVIGAALGPLLPATSALSVARSPQQLGDILARTTRYSTIVLLLTGLPVVVGGYIILRLWVGSNYAVHSIEFLRILLLANIVRNLCAPYSTMVVALSRQRVATAAAITEAVVNLGCSIWFAKHYGAIGVAMGTLVGSFAGVAMHFGVSMAYTQTNFAVPRMQLFLKGILRPSAIALPSLLLLPLWWREAAPALNVGMWAFGILGTLLLAWFAAITAAERSQLRRFLRRRLRPSQSAAATQEGR